MAIRKYGPTSPGTRFRTVQTRENLSDIEPLKKTGEFVDPEFWNKIASDPEIILLDTRNIYEHSIGTFKGALLADTKSFREFPEWAEKNLKNMKKKTTYFQVLDEIYSVVNSRIVSKKNKSYTNKLIKQGKNRIAQKVLEESSELVIDFLKGTKKRTTEEVSDLLYHVIVLLKVKGVSPKDIAKELRSRYKK